MKHDINKNGIACVFPHGEAKYEGLYVTEANDGYPARHVVRSVMLRQTN